MYIVGKGALGQGFAVSREATKISPGDNGSRNKLVTKVTKHMCHCDENIKVQYSPCSWQLRLETMGRVSYQ